MYHTQPGTARGYVLRGCYGLSGTEREYSAVPGGATTIVPLLRLFDTVGEIEIWDPWGTDQGAEGTDAGSDAPLREVHQYINGSLMFGPVDVPVVATQPAMGAWGTVTGQVTRPVAVGHVLEGFGCGEKEVRGGRSWNCNVLPVREGPLKQRFEALG